MTTTPWDEVASVRAGVGRLTIRTLVDGPRLVLPQAQDQPGGAFVADLLHLLPRRLLDGDVETFLQARYASTRSIEVARQTRCPTCRGPWATRTSDLLGSFGDLTIGLADEPHRRCESCGAIAPVGEEQVGEIANGLAAEGEGRTVGDWVDGFEVTTEELLSRRATGRHRARLAAPPGRSPTLPTFGHLALATLDALVQGGEPLGSPTRRSVTEE